MALKKRKRFLEKRIDLSGRAGHTMTYDRQERAALRFALDVIETADAHNLIVPNMGITHEEER